MRTCEQGVCVDHGEMHEFVETFELPAALQCSHTASRKCAVAVRNYLVATTQAGFAVFNTRNPSDIRQETVPNNIGVGYSYLVRSGERVWATTSPSGTTKVAWLDLPLDGVSPLSAPSKANLVIPPPSVRLAAPNDTIYLFHVDNSDRKFVAQYAPGLPVLLTSHELLGANEDTAVASTGSRLLLYKQVLHAANPNTYRHHFSLQSELLSDSSTNHRTYEEANSTTSYLTPGFFASSRLGAVAWVTVTRNTSLQWEDVRAFWLVADDTAPIQSDWLPIAEYTTSPNGTPHGPVAFFNNDTIATTILSGGTSSTPTLVIVNRQENLNIVKRIPISPLTHGSLTVAGDAGYTYVIKDRTVRMFAPLCSP
ncbi:MAG: hypothetical protein CSA75_01750 [Sorangium cellulosum]|nr:MAG: hypothetical protein CSA75_01750 [Sorangium cellulosum]